MSSNPHRSALLDTWTETSSHVFNSVLAANRAAFAAFGVNSDDDTDEDPTLPPRERIEPDEDLPEWTIERTEDDRTELGVGDRIEFTKTISEDDVTSFAAASGDTNPLHLDDEYASETRFRGRIAHGTLVGGLISAALARVPGLVVYLSQDLEFHNPVRIGDRLTAEIEIVEDLGNDQFRLTTQVKQDEEVVIDGEAVILVDEQPE
ncbi:Acyl dehydratase [Halorientalis persicus]|jgi:3-hydroxybutyryl-CoA dehydratase|uniref:Acyl dehydratase n=1 Tax=Halorientalis persicus TaxID=1367881 RepID=A0A1H8GBK9_9EURY|nr:MaoC family dehydratase [Halorientalis persicus]SEN41436.1 Acyl dehydratase [Halorientalis persicus]